MDPRFLIGGLPSVWWIQGGARDAPPTGIQIISLPLANEVWGKVIFLHLFVILFTGGGKGLPVHAGIPPPRPGTPRTRHPPGPATPHAHRTRPPRRRACWEIRSMRGRYASYWNAILFSCSFWQNVCKIIPLWDLPPLPPGKSWIRHCNLRGGVNALHFNFLKNPMQLKKIGSGIFFSRIIKIKELNLCEKFMFETI